MPGDQKIQAPNPLSAEITSVEPISSEQSKSQKSTFFWGDGGMGGGFNIVCDLCA